MSEMGSHVAFEYLKHKLWPKEGSRVKVPIWLPTTKSQKSPLIYLCAGDMPNIFGKILTRAIILLWTSFQLKVCKKNYRPLKLQEYQFQEFWNSRLGNPKTKWHLSVTPMAKHKDKREGGGFPQVRAMVSLVNPCMLVVRLCTKNVWIKH
jgi:hypothetical protein